MKLHNLALFLSLAFVMAFAACGSEETLQQEDRSTGSNSIPASIVGSISTAGASQDVSILAADGDCPELIVTLNGSPATIVFEEDCSFLISDVQPSENVVLRIKLPGPGMSATIELEDVVEGELIEIQVQVGSNTLSISVVRRAEPEPVSEIPEVIEDNNVTILVPAGLYEQNLTVRGNNFTLIGEAGEGCDEGDWTIIRGEVSILKNNATFRNIAFDGQVEVRGNNTRFINCCFNGMLVVFGNNTDFDCRDCKGKVTQLTLRYLGDSTATIEVEQKKDEVVVFQGTVDPGETFTFNGMDKKGVLGTEIRVHVDGDLNTKIHTSCSQPIGPGLVSGDFEVVEGYSREGGLLCPLQ